MMNLFFQSHLLSQSAVQGINVMTVGDKSYTIQELFNMGGAMMWPILFLSIVGVFVFLLCLFITRSGNVMSTRFMESAEALIARRDYVGLEFLCEKEDTCIARITLRVVRYMAGGSHPTQEELSEIAAAEGARQAGIFTRKVSWLSDIGSVAPMFGLLGTVTGMIRTFFEISNGNFEGVKQMQMAGGVAEALLTTAAGLMVGIPSLLSYAYFRGVVQKNLSNLESAATHIVALLSVQKRKSTQGNDDFRFRAEELEMPNLNTDNYRGSVTEPRL